MSNKLFLFPALIFLIIFSTQASIIDTLDIKSIINGKIIRSAVVTPEGYQKNQQPLPVLYLLHGFSDSFDSWLKFPPSKSLVQEMSDKYNIIIVCPDGGYGSWYLDSPLQKDYQYESFIIKELVPAIDKKYRTLAKRESRVITGLSMGGFGSLYLSLRNPTIFAGAGSISGAMDVYGSTKIPGMQSKQVKNWFLKILGDPLKFPDRYKNITILNLTTQLKNANIKITFDCGVNDFLFEGNKALHKKLLLEKIPHDYTERPGTHNWEYFSNSLEYHLVFFNKFLKRK